MFLLWFFFASNLYSIEGITVVSPKKQEKHFKFGNILYKLEIAQNNDRDNVVKVIPLVDLAPATLSEEGDLPNSTKHGIFLINNYEREHQRELPILKSRPLTSYGRNLKEPPFYGLRGYGFYSYAAGNDFHNNLPRGGYKIESDHD